MPRFDGTGPDFSGPMTGGARGWCVGDAAMAAADDGPVQGIGRGWRHGRNRGTGPRMRKRQFRNRPTVVPDSDAGKVTVLNQLEQQAAAMQQQLEALNARIESLKSGATE